MFSDNRWMLIGVTSVMLIVVLAFFLSGKVTDKLEQFSLALMLSGGVGNLIDRISLGYVIDYIDISKIFSYPVFNFADICIVIGVILVIIIIIINTIKSQESINERV